MFFDSRKKHTHTTEDRKKKKKGNSNAQWMLKFQTIQTFGFLDTDLLFSFPLSRIHSHDIPLPFALFSSLFSFSMTASAEVSIYRAPMHLLESHSPRSYLNYMCCVLSCSVVYDSLRPHGLQPFRLLCSCGFSKQEYWSGLPFPSLGDLPDPGIEPAPSAWAGGFFTAELK